MYKQLADLITWVRSALLLVFPWLGASQGRAAMPAVVALVIANWTLDSLDGPLARRQRNPRRTWIGDHDLQIDMLITVGLLAYLALAQFTPWQLAAAYLLASLLLLWWVDFHAEASKLFQGPIYLWFVFTILSRLPQFAWWLILWLVAATVVTWPKFPHVILPAFLGGMRDIWSRYRPGAP